jgi:hypothetical protein
MQEQGSFAVGGSVLTSPEGRMLHGDHGYVFSQQPENPRETPLVFLHGIFQCSQTWETTPDGREGGQNLFLRRGFATYNILQSCRGHAGRSTVPATLTLTADAQGCFNQFRRGVWPDDFAGVQCATDTETLNQYFRQQTPNIGPFAFDVNTDAIAALCEKLGGAIMGCHSHG